MRFWVYLLADVVIHRVWGLGFYSDDWTFLELHAKHGVLGMLRVMEWTRPGQVLLAVLTYALGAAHPLLAQAPAALLVALEAYLVARVVEQLTKRTDVALWAGLLLVAHPARMATVLWPSVNVQLAAHCLALGAMLVDDDRGWKAAAGPALYLASVLTYESAVFLLPAVIAGSWAVAVAARLQNPVSVAIRWPSWKRALRYGAVLGAGFAWQTFGPSPSPKSVKIKGTHVLRVYSEGALDLIGRNSAWGWE